MDRFKPIELEDRRWVDPLLQTEKRFGCEYSFGCNYIWRKIYQIQIAQLCGCFALRNTVDDHYEYNYPVGKPENRLQAVKAIFQLHDPKTGPLIFRGMSKEHIDELETAYPGQFSFSSNRDEADYIYLSERLISLSGKKLQSKRNHIRRFCDNPDWCYEDITKDNIDECREMNRKWCEIHGCFSDDGLKAESCAVNEAFQHFFDLDFKGGLIRQNGTVIAFSIGEAQNDELFTVHIEKAMGDIQGAYAIINREFAKHNCAQYQYINREEDMGDAGMRKAKLSYQPEIVLEKYTAIQR